MRLSRQETATGQPVIALNRFEQLAYRYPLRGKLRVSEPLIRRFAAHHGLASVIAEAPSGLLVLDLENRNDRQRLFGGIEQSVTNWLEANFKGLTSAWDIGAFHGEYTMTFARLCGAEGEVHAFEPVPDSVRVLREQAELNDMQQVKVHHCAVWNSNTDLEIFVGGERPQTSSIISNAIPQGGTQLVQAHSMDDLVLKLGAPEIVKIDVEGAELEVVQGGDQTLRDAKPTLLFESETWDSRRTETHLQLTSLGYELWSFARPRFGGRARLQKGTDGRMILAQHPRP